MEDCRMLIPSPASYYKENSREKAASAQESHSSALKKDFEQKVGKIRIKEQEKEQVVNIDYKQYIASIHPYIK